MRKTAYLYEVYEVDRKQDSVRVWAIDANAAAYTFAYLKRNNEEVIFQRPEYTNICTFKIGNVKYLCKRVKT